MQQRACNKSNRQAPLDFNLFTVLDAIYAEGSITRAAERLHLSQSAVSHALARLREVYDEPLFVRSGNGMLPTSRTKEIIGPIRQSLANLKDTLQPVTQFDAGSARNPFAISLPDVLDAWALPPLMQTLQREAPSVQLTCMRVRRRELEVALTSGRLDLALDVLLPVAASIRHAPVMEEAFVVVMRRGHPLGRAKWGMKAYEQARHIVVSARRAGLSAEDFELSRLGYRREIALRCANYHVAWSTMLCTDLLLTVPARYVQLHAASSILQRPVPASIRGMAIQMYWHEAVEHDPASLWLREILRGVLARNVC
ncbi:Transcriptional regulator, LysR family [gamma proteobacterium HdN1]|nr:Transcriptional regulator, LysR family [gamma proteobacterium HdN1]